MRTPNTVAELWDPVNVSRTPLTMSADKTVKLHLKPYESTFIVVR